MKRFNDNLLALGQIILSTVFVGGYFIVLYDFIHGYIAVKPEWKDTLQALVSILTAGIFQILGFWFARHRTSSLPPPRRTS